MSLTSKLGTKLIEGLFSKRGALCQTPRVSSAATLHSFLNRTMASSSNEEDTSKLIVEHDLKNHKFFIKLGEAEAKLEYVAEKGKAGGKVYNMWHTEVPPQLQGRGIAKVLAKEAFEYCIQNGLGMRLSCSYLQKYFNENPLDKYKAAVVE